MAGSRYGADDAGGRAGRSARPHRSVARSGHAIGRSRRAPSGPSHAAVLARGRRQAGSHGRGQVDVHAPYLDAVPGAREAVRQAAEEVGGRATERRLPGIRVADEGGNPAGARDRERGVPCAALLRSWWHEPRRSPRRRRCRRARGRLSPHGSTTMPGASRSAGRAGNGLHGWTRRRRTAPSVPRSSTRSPAGGSGPSPCSPRAEQC